MKRSLAAFALVTGLSFNTFAAEVKATKDSVRPSEVQKVVVVQAAKGNKPSIKLVKVTNGGSTDISGYVSPSRLYLGMHLNAEMFDTSANYLVDESIVQIEEAALSGDGKTIRAKVLKRDETTMTILRKTLLISIGNALKAIDEAQSEMGETAEIKTTIGVEVK